MKITIRLKDKWQTVTVPIADTDNEAKMKRLLADKLKAKEYRHIKEYEILTIRR